MEDELASLAGSKYFATLDLMQGYWQLPLHEDSQECQSIITPDGVYTPTRVQHGTTNATVHMQSIMEELMHDIRHSVNIWLDDNMIHVTDEKKLLEVLEHFLQTVTKHSYLLLASDEFSILSDHFNLKYMDAPLSLDPSLARNTVSKIQRWALKLATYNYRI
jgi:Reverse transcriptase (RNA-dependent DNA polymerase)